MDHFAIFQSGKRSVYRLLYHGFRDRNLPGIPNKIIEEKFEVLGG